MITPSSLLSVAADDGFVEIAQRFAQKYNYRYRSVESAQQSDATPYVLYYSQSGTVLLQTGKGAPGPISASFLAGKNAHRRQFGGGKGQLIAKAVGLGSGVIPRVLDATAGLGRDGFVLASLGCDVTLLERSPVVAALLAHAIDEAGGSEISDIAARLHLIQCDAIDWLRGQGSNIADVIYLDPMYPSNDKSAQVKKEMRAFHDLVGESYGDEQLLEIALRKARCRVVVKRPRKGVAIPGLKPSYELSGKSCRYDIYTLSSLAVLKSL